MSPPSPQPIAVQEGGTVSTLKPSLLLLFASLRAATCQGVLLNGQRFACEGKDPRVSPCLRRSVLPPDCVPSAPGLLLAAGSAS